MDVAVTVGKKSWKIEQLLFEIILWNTTNTQAQLDALQVCMRLLRLMADPGAEAGGGAALGSDVQERNVAEFHQDKNGKLSLELEKIWCTFANKQHCKYLRAVFGLAPAV